MRYLALGEVVELHRLVLAAIGGAPGIRDLGALESAVAQPRASFGESDLHPGRNGAIAFELRLRQLGVLADEDRRAG
jgi:hypothetical protein